MKLLFNLGVFLLLFFFSTCESEESCDASQNCETSAQTSNNSISEPLTLGQKILLKQNYYYKRYNIPDNPQESAAMSIRVYNPNDISYESFWWDTYRNQGIYTGPIRPKSLKTTTSYIGHTFYMTTSDDTQKEIWRFTVVKDKYVYIIPPTNPEDDYYKQALEFQQFNENYIKTNKRPWLSHYPRNPPILFQWKAEKVGQIHKVISNETYWNCIPQDLDNPEEIAKCRSKNPLELHIEVVSLEPKLFVINNTLSKFEIKLIKSLAKPKLKRSLAGTDGGIVTETRTSQTCWLDRKEHLVLETIYRRAANILNISESLLYTDKNVEQMQVVYYKKGAEYKAHHDFGDHGYPESRYITLLFYLSGQSDMDAGGETLFPKGNNHKGLYVHPGKGSSALFYSLKEDGNGDDLTLHEASRVNIGSKWLCNFWVWDPHRHF